jgi:isoquinoline 1-oxidoreductase subunit alpha
MQFTLLVNSQAHTVEADPDTPLLWVLREQLQLTGTKFGCGIAACGACTVHIDGAAVRSCSVALQSVPPTANVTTIEGLAAAGQPHAVQAAWLEHQVPQCGYCQSGMIMAVTAMLAAQPRPTDAMIDEQITNICRCGTYERVRRAIHALTNAGEVARG